MTTEPTPQSTVEHPHVINGPWTREARERAIQDEVREAYIEYFRKAVKVRNWLPWDDIPLDEVRQYGHLLSDDTITLIESFLGIEDYVGDYVEDAINIVRGNRERRNIQLVWGMEEAKHAEAWHLVLLHSGRRTEEQIRAYRDKVGAHRWRMREDHPGLDTPLGIAVYAMFQERATYFNYEELRKRIRLEYGLPERATPEERRRGYQVGAAAAFNIVARDEIAHHGMFLRIVDIHKKYLPAETLDMIFKVIQGFKMPALYLIPNESELKAALERTRLYTPLKHGRSVANPILDALGFENKRALERAAQEAKLLPPGCGPEHVAIGRSGEFVLSITPERTQVTPRRPQTA
ncbi:acyl-ACP desaturase [Kallotenue papyrolyticum]|uniref:acyl-ACP desaturase n=1 Tax=Kallotenue papyrolyticum TaxID=1325125 RepID=UPI0004B3C2E4|nr:acyl-ACP desaturase [Kallotenue papyrolyticum]